MLKKVIAVYSCIVDDVPMLEEEIGLFICDQMLMNQIDLNKLNIGNIKDDDHKDMTKVSSIFSNIVSKGISCEDDNNNFI